MRYLVITELPSGMAPEMIGQLIEPSYRYQYELTKAGRIEAAYVIVGKKANVAIYNVENHAELLDVLTGDPLGNFQEHTIYPLVSPDEAQKSVQKWMDVFSRATK